MRARRLRGVTLVELMIVIAILSIVVAIGYPLMTDYVRKGRRAEAKAALQDLALREERWRVSHTSYTDDLDILTGDTTADPDAPQPQISLPADFYDYSVAADAFTFTVQADGKNGQQNDALRDGTSCATLTLNQNGDQGTDPDCW